MYVSGSLSEAVVLMQRVGDVSSQLECCGKDLSRRSPVLPRRLHLLQQRRLAAGNQAVNEAPGMLLFARACRAQALRAVRCHVVQMLMILKSACIESTSWMA